MLHSNRGNRGYKELHNDRLVVNMDEKGVDEGGRILSSLYQFNLVLGK